MSEWYMDLLIMGFIVAAVTGLFMWRDYKESVHRKRKYQDKVIKSIWD